MKNKGTLFSITLLGLVLLSACKSADSNPTQTTTAELYARLSTAPGNITFSYSGDLIYSSHPFYDPAIRVMRYDAAAQTSTPFPSEAWNTPQADNDNYLSTVLGVRAEENGVVWLLDMGYRNQIIPKLVGWNTKTNALERIYKIPAPASLPSSQLNDFLIDNTHHVFIIADEDIGPEGDGSHGALVVVDRATGTSRRLLEGHYSTVPENVPIVVDGKQLNKPGTNDPILVGADGIVADKNDEWLYYAPLNGRNVYRIKIVDLLNQELTDEALGKKVETYAQKENNGGISIDQEDNLYLTYLESKSVGIIPADGKKSHHYVTHQDMIWPDGVSYNKDGYMYVPAPQLPLASVFNDGADKTTKPFYILRFKPVVNGIFGR